MEQIIITKVNGTSFPLQSKANSSTIITAKQTVELLNSDIVDITLESAKKIVFDIGDKITILGRDYTMNIPAKEEKLANNFFRYDLQFEGVQYDLSRASYDVNIDTTGADVQGDTLTGNMKSFLDVLIANISRIFPGKWTLGTYPAETEVMTLTFGDSDNCLSVLQMLCDKYKQEFDIVIGVNGARTLNIGQAGKTFTFTFQYGKGKGIYELTREKVASSNIINRLKVYGSTKNITSKYRSTRLLLPGKTKAQSYLEDAASIAKYGVWEGTKIFEEIFPNRVGVVSALGPNRLTFVDSSMDFDLNEREADGVTTKYLMAGTAAKIHFNTGNLTGYDFDIHSYDHATKTFVIVEMKDERDMIFPSQTSAAFQIGVGDKYIIKDIGMPATYETAGENELQTEGLAFLQQNCQPKVQYGISVSQFFLKNIVGADAQSNIFWVGDYIPVKDDDLEVDKLIRVKTFTRDLLTDYDYSLTIADLTVTRTVYNRVISELREIDKTIVINNLKDPARARRNYLSAQELLNKVFDTEGDYYSAKIKPLSIETSMLSVGAKSMQFGLENTVFQPNYAGAKNRIVYKGGTLTHYAILDGNDNPRTWEITDGDVTLVSDAAFYVYAKCQRAGSGGVILFSTSKISVEQDGSFFHFLIGIANSVDATTNTRALALMYGFTTINGRYIRTGRITSADGNTYFDLDTGEIGGKITFKSGSSGLTNMNEWPAVAQDIETAQSTASQAVQSAASLQSYVDNTLPAELSALQSQIDGNITSWFFDYEPTLANAPASNWTDNSVKDIHLGDLFYWTSKGYSYRFQKVGTVYSWSLLQDTDVSKALADAAAAKDTADSKRRVFVTQPTTPYDVGDLWTQGTSGELMRCINQRLSGAYVVGDWEKAVKYTDDTAVNNLQIGGRNLMLDSNRQLTNASEYAFVDIPVSTFEVGQEYTWSFDAKVEGNFPPPYFNVYTQGVLMSNGQQYFPFNNGITATQDYKRYNVTFKWQPTSPVTSADIQMSFYCVYGSGSFPRVKQPKLEKGNKATDWTPAPEDVTAGITEAKEDAAAAQSSADTANAAVSSLNNYVDGSFKDGVISEAEAQAIEKYTNSVNASKLQIQSAYTQLYANAYLEGTAKTNLASAKTALDTAITNLLASISAAIADGQTTPTEKADVDAKFASYNSALSTYQTRVEESNKAIQDKLKTYSDAASLTATEAKNYIDNVLPNYIASLQEQLDGVVDTWYFAYVPTLANFPASDWTTDTIKARHVGDTFTNTQPFISDVETPDAGKSWRFLVNAGVYSWSPISDSDAVKALLAASKAQDTADNKRRNFVIQPFTPYEVGDLWVQGTSGDLMKCITTRLTGAFNAADWEKAVKYTDDTTANAAATAAANAQTAANTANALLADIASDNKLTPVEKKSVRAEWDTIAAEKSVNDAQADTFGITTEKATYGTKFQALATYLNNNTAWSSGVPVRISDENLSVTTDIVGSTFRLKFKEYYDARTALLNAVAAKAKTLANNAQTAADNAATAASNAQSSANTANSLLSDIASDSKFTPVEKQQTKIEWDAIVSEKGKNDAQADAFSVSKTAYGTKYTALSDYITPLLANLATTSDITGTDFRAKFKDYYDARTDMLNAIASAAKTQAIDAASTDATNKVNSVQVGGRNLLLNSNVEKGGSSEYLHYENLTSLFDQHGVGNFMLSFDLRLAISGDVNVYSWPGPLSDFKYIWAGATISATTSYVRYSIPISVSVSNPASNYSSLSFYAEYGTGKLVQVKNVKIERGNKATDWTPAPEDVQIQIDNIVSDNVLSASEKPSQRQAWDIAAAEKAGLNSQATAFGITTENTAYNNAFQALANYLNAGTAWTSGIPSWLSDANLAVNTTIVGSTYRTTWTTFYNARTSLLNAISAKAKQIADQIEVGGRNLVRNSLGTYTGVGALKFYTLSEPLVQGVTYSVSVKGDVGSGASFNVWVNKNNQPVLNLNGSGIAKGTFVFGGGAYPSEISVYSENTTNPSTVYWVKIEKGNKPTDWSPAPEDTDYIKNAFKDGSTDISGGVVATNVLMMKTIANAIVGGMSGLASDNIGFWSGGTYAQALANLAKIIMRKDGSGQLAGGRINWNLGGDLNVGDMYVDAGGSLVIKDSTGTTRVLLTRTDIATLYAIENSTQNQTVNNLSHQVSAEGSTVFNFANNIVVSNNNSEVTVVTTLSSDIYGDTINYANPQGSTYLLLQLVDQATGYVAADIDSISTYLEGTSHESNTQSVNKKVVLQAGTYKLRITYSHINFDGCTFSSTVDASTTTIFFDGSIQRTELGKNGIGIIGNATNYMFAGMEAGVFKMVEKCSGVYDKPGVLAAASVSSAGSSSRQWGAKTGTSSKTATGTYQINHSIGHTDYTIQITPNTAGRIAYISARYSTYCIVVLTNTSSTATDTAFDYLITGKN